MARLRRSIIKVRVTRKHLDLKRDALSGNPFLEGVDWQFIQGFLKRELLD